MDPTTFLAALAAIVVIDIVLAGDNAIVIALAARNLPAPQRRRAIVWGAVGAIAVRSALTLAVVWLLQIPGLLLAGGILLLWIAYRLLVPGEAAADARPAAVTFWGAMRTIVVADAAMGMDNVLAVAGAAHGSVLLVVIGLAISVPIVVWGSTMVLKLVDRFPAVIYVGAAVLVWTAVRMMLAEGAVQSWAAQHPLPAAWLYALIPLVLGLGFVANHRRFESRIHARLAQFAPLRPPGATRAAAPTCPADEAGGSTAQAPSRLRVLVPVDGSPNALRALHHVIDEYRRHHELEVHLLNVQPPLSRHVARFLGRGDRRHWHQARAAEALAAAQRVLAKAGVPCESHWVVGERAREICAAAQRLQTHHLVLGTARGNSITRMLDDSLTDRVLDATPVPVEVVTGPAVARWERWGVPATVVGLACFLALSIGLD